MMKLFLVLIALIAYQWLPAQQNMHQIINKAGDEKVYPGKQELVIFDSTRVEVQESGLSKVYMHKLVKMLNKNGCRQNSSVIIGYDPLSAYVEIQGITIYRNNGEVEVLSTDNVLDYPAPARAIYWGAREKIIEVGRLEPNDAIDIKLFRKGFTYALLQDDQPDDERYIPPMRGHYYDIIEFWSTEQVIEKVYQVKLPSDKKLQFEVYNGELRTTLKYDGDKSIYTFSRENFSEPKLEANMVAPSDEFTKLLLSTSPDWEAKSTWFYKVNEDFGSFESNRVIDNKVAEILKGAKNEMDSISQLTHWCADNIRYSGISMGEGEGFTLHKGVMTCTDRCGVCKDKAGMLITMLRAAGFKSYAAMTMAGSRIDRIPADQFNHSVTIVKLSNGNYKILDPTWVPFVRELWSSLEQQQNYLMGVPEGADLMITPISDPMNHYLNIDGKSSIDKKGTYSGTLTLEAEGQSDAALRRMFTSGYISVWSKTLESEFLQSHPRAKISKLDFGEPYNYMSGPLKIVITYEIPDYAIVTDKEIIFTPVLVSDIFKRAMSHLNLDTDIEKRNYEFRDRCSRSIQITESVNLPKNVSIEYLPSNAIINGSGAAFKSAFYIQDNQLKVTENVKLKKRIYEPEDWESVRETVLSQNKLAKEPVILNIEN